MVIEEGAHVYVWDFNDNFKCNKMDDRMLYSVLIQKHEQIQELCGQIQIMSCEHNHKHNSRMCELIRVIDGILDKLHRSSHLWIKHEM